MFLLHSKECFTTILLASPQLLELNLTFHPCGEAGI